VVEKDFIQIYIDEMRKIE